MEKKFAMAVSIIFQPIFIPLYSLFVLYNADTYITYAVQPNIKLWTYGITLVNSILIPIGLFYYFLKAGLIESLHMHTAKERSLPFLATIVFHLSTYFWFCKLPIPSLFQKSKNNQPKQTDNKYEKNKRRTSPKTQKKIEYMNY
jgi:hypothetical protein